MQYYASLQSRIAAKVVDVVLFLIPSVFLAAYLSEFHAVQYMPGIVWISLLLIADGMFNGQSPGKKLFKIQVVSVKNGLPCGYLRSIVRNLFLFDFVIVFGALIDGLLWHSTNRRVGDFAAATCVVNLLVENKPTSSRET